MDDNQSLGNASDCGVCHKICSCIRLLGKILERVRRWDGRVTCWRNSFIVCIVKVWSLNGTSSPPASQE
jgi:hypothetical protein